MSMKNHDVLQVSEVFRAPVTPFVHPGHRPVPGHGYVSGHLSMGNSAFNEKNGDSTGLNMIKPSLLWDLCGIWMDMGALYILVTTVIDCYCGCLWNWRITPKSMAIQMMDHGIWIFTNHHRLWYLSGPINCRDFWTQEKHEKHEKPRNTGELAWSPQCYCLDFAETLKVLVPRGKKHVLVHARNWHQFLTEGMNS